MPLHLAVIELPVIAVVLLVLVLALLLRVALGKSDEGRVAAWIARRGGKLTDIRWTPFGKGWVGDKIHRLYTVRYVDADGNEHEATCKTSMLTGVHWTGDRIAAAGARSRAQGVRITAEGPTESIRPESLEH